MKQFPDIYQIEKELGHNRAGGRVTYLARDTSTQQMVVIKQFQFAQLGSSWSDYDTYQREIQLLQDLNHPGIPRYLGSFHTDSGFCMVQEYKAATSLAASRSFNPDEIKQIAIAALEVLVYLQNRIPPVIHRDIKPENILVDRRGKLYLVDFGFARVGEGEVGVSSVVKGTLGFMPPEQLFNRQLTEASDLYGLGMTLICLLTQTKSDRIGDLVDISYRVSFKHLLPTLSVQWINWLEKMVEPRLKDRFPNALTALAAIPTTPLRPPDAQLSCSTLHLSAMQSGEVLTHPIDITNPIPDTMLEGQWEVVPHPHDPGGLDQWIAVEPAMFFGNQMRCQVKVQTNALMLGKTYHRQLRLQTNTLAKTYTLHLQVRTAPLPIHLDWLPYWLLSGLGVFSIGVSWLLGWGFLILSTVSGVAPTTGLVTTIGAAIGLESAAWMMRSSGWRTGPTTSTLAAVILGVAGLVKALSDNLAAIGSGLMLGVGVGVVAGVIAGIATGLIAENLVTREIHPVFAIATSLLTLTAGTSLGLGCTLGYNVLLSSLLILSSLALGLVGLQVNLKQIRTRLNHHQTERFLIKP